MSNFVKEWEKQNKYNFSIEFNRIEKYNKYVESWLKNYYGFSFENLIHKVDWDISDIVYLDDYNRVKYNINVLIEQISTLPKLSINEGQVNQRFNVQKANEIEIRFTDFLQTLGNAQFEYRITGLYNCGSNILGI